LKLISLLDDALQKIWSVRKTRENRLYEVKKSPKAFTKSATTRPWKFLATRQKREHQNTYSMRHQSQSILRQYIHQSREAHMPIYSPKHEAEKNVKK
jgi:hypothetical protein